jgi:Raf kinase inhibitor-like YbhB/YbcL family protein
MREATMRLVSTAFQEGSSIPRKHTGDGSDVSPSLQWSGPPAGVKSFALICDDPDAPRGTWVHWLLWNLPADAVELGENVPRKPELPSGARQGINDGGDVGYAGPCPPPGGPHRYYFRLHALDSALNLPPGVNRSDLEAAMEGHVLARAVTMGTYQRRKR